MLVTAACVIIEWLIGVCLRNDDRCSVCFCGQSVSLLGADLCFKLRAVKGLWTTGRLCEKKHEVQLTTEERTIKLASQIGKSWMGNPPEKISPYASAIDWVSRITAIALEMTLPGLAGSWFDQRQGTWWWAPTGFVLGFTAGLWHLLVMVRAVKLPNDREGKGGSGGGRA